MPTDSFTMRVGRPRKSRQRPRSEFQFTSGALCLDFANTLEDRPSPQPYDRIQCYADLLAWSESATILTRRQRLALLRQASRRPQQAARVFHHAIVLRETIFKIFVAVASKRKPVFTILNALSHELRRLAQNLVIIHENDQFRWAWKRNGNSLDQILWPVARSAAELLISDGLQRLKQCAASDCGWLFLDFGRGRGRRWCEMKTCGNRWKVREYYKRRRRYEHFA